MGESDTLLEFPCKFPVKMMGRADAGFREVAIDLIARHAGKVPAESVQTNSSSNGNYVSVTITIDARSQEQLDRIYQDLSDHKDILVAL